MRVLILGGSGYLGSHATEGLLRLGYQVRVLSRSGVGLLPTHILSHPRFELLDGDITSPSVCRKALSDCFCVINCIGTTSPAASVENPTSDWYQQVHPHLQLFTALREIQSIRLIFISSGGTIYGPNSIIPSTEASACRPICPYGIHKLSVENYLYQEHYLNGLDYLVLRLSNPYGGRQRFNAKQGVPSIFMHKILNGDPIILWGDGSVRRDFIHVSDFVSALASCIPYKGDFRIFNVGSSSSVSLNDLIYLIECLSGRNAIVQTQPARAYDVPISQLDINRILSETGWSPKVDLKTGLSKSLIDYRSQA